MKVSHVLYKVNDLECAFHQFTSMGFKVEYGSKKKPQNALIYFSEGPYIELLEAAPVSRLTKIILKLIGRKNVVDRFDSWAGRKEGFFEVCLETQHQNFLEEEKILQRFGINYFITKSQRLDPSNRLLKWSLLFPHELNIPFFMTCFNIDPKPHDFIHPNGIRRIKFISYGSAPRFLPLLAELCCDTSIGLFEGKGIRDVVYE